MAKVFLKKMCSMYVKMKLSSRSSECTLHFSVLEKYKDFFKKLKKCLTVIWSLRLYYSQHSLTGHTRPFLLIFIRFDRFLTFVSNWNIFIHWHFRKKTQRNLERNEIPNEMISSMASSIDSKTIYCMLKKIDV